MILALALGLALTACDKGEGGNNGPDKRSQLVGTYPIVVTTTLTSIDPIYTDLLLELDGHNNFKASGSADTGIVGVLSIGGVLNVKKEITEVGGKPAVGYYFDVEPQQIDILGLQTFVGSKQYDGYDGRVYKVDGKYNIAFEVVEKEKGLFSIKAVTGSK